MPINDIFSFIHSYINYSNIAWDNTSKTKLKNIYFKQKHRIIFHEYKEANAKLLLKEICALNAYQINIIKTFIFMQKSKNYNNSSSIFESF